MPALTLSRTPALPVQWSSLLACLLAFAVTGCAQRVEVAQAPAAEILANVVPMPTHLVRTGGELTLGASVAVTVEGEAPHARRALDTLLAGLGVASGKGQGVQLRLQRVDDPS